eukprot:TRINITY_DN2217_c0_g1_i2.p1 TRINITY_DN2217_c0_g1~~TRINITY_DN2217_c0_g1_i2.p1  ORF type:complete len:1264 (-),score=329.77 TRINITY_DN2217_c0_g1_i2:33-3467(-)
MTADYEQIFYAARTSSFLDREYDELIRNHVHLNSDVFGFAAKVLHSLGQTPFNAIHIDASFNDLSPQKIMDNIVALFGPRSRIYVMFERKGSFLNPSTEEIKFFKELNSLLGLKYEALYYYMYRDAVHGIPAEWISLVESIICTQADVFVGTAGSDLTYYIQRLRTYMEKGNQDLRQFFINTAYTGDLLKTIKPKPKIIFEDVLSHRKAFEDKKQITSNEEQDEKLPPSSPKPTPSSSSSSSTSSKNPPSQSKSVTPVSKDKLSKDPPPSFVLPLNLSEQEREHFKIQDHPFDKEPIRDISPYEKADLKRIIDNANWWDREDVSKTPKPIIPNRFFTWKIMESGFSNRRMCLEVAFAFAYVTNRTFVLHPPHYLVPFRELGLYEKFWDFEGMKNGWPTLSYDEFKALPNYDEIMADTISLPWNDLTSQESVVFIPKMPTQGSEDWEDYVNWRKPKSIQIPPNYVHNLADVDRINEAKNVYLDGLGFAQFYATFYPLKESGLKFENILRLLRDHLHLRPEISNFAARIIAKLPPTFSTIHYRRGDLDYPTAKLTPHQVFINTFNLFEPGEHIYVATDEWPDRFEEFKKIFGLKYNIHHFPMYKDLVNDIDPKWVPLVEQLVCAQGRTFVGTLYSTFTSYMHKVRGYMPSILNKNFYFTHLTYYETTDHQRVDHISWDRENPQAFQPIINDYPLNDDLVPPKLPKRPDTSEWPKERHNLRTITKKLLTFDVTEEDRKLHEIPDSPSDPEAIVDIPEDEITKLEPFIKKFTYWNKPAVSKEPKPIIPGRFFTYKLYQSGFNNRRMCLEMAYAFAYVTNRTLVLQPPHRLTPYNQLGLTEKFWDLDGLKSGWPTITYDEYKKLPDYQKYVKDTINLEWKDISTGDSLLAIPELPKKGTPEWEHYIKWRLPRKPEIPSEWGSKLHDFNEVSNFNTASTVHLNSHPFTQYYIFFYPHPTLSTIKTTDILRLIRDHTHFRPEIVHFAARILAEMPESFSSMHWRRGDLDYKTSKVTPEEMFVNTFSLLKDGEHLYLATDANDEELQKFLPIYKTRYRVHTFSSYKHLTTGMDPKWVSMIEQLICSQGRVFVGTLYSTLTSYIHRMRGFMPHIENKNFYFHHNFYVNLTDFQKVEYYGWDREWPKAFEGLED